MNYYSINCEDGNIFSGPKLCKPKIHRDERGYFFESWNSENFQKATQKEHIFAQDNESLSFYGVLRGLHYQLNPQPQGKLIKVTYGKIFDVFVDIRKSSNTFMKYYGVELSDKNKIQLWIPKGFAHGFLTLSEYAIVNYKVTNPWAKDLERTILWNDKEINIHWPMSKLKLDKPKLSEKDSSGQELRELAKIGEIFE